MTRINPEAANIARQARLNLDNLSQPERARLDTNNDGELGGAEVSAAVRLIDLDKNQFVDGAEAGKLKALLAEERSGRNVELFQELSGRGQQVLAGLESGFQDARMKFEQAARRLPRGEEPRRGVRELKQERASLADPAKLQATVQEKSASLAANGAQVKQLEAQLAQLERQAMGVRRARVGGTDVAEALKQSIAAQEAELARLPRGERKETLQKLVDRDRERLPELEARRDTLDALEPRIAQLRASIGGLKGRIAQDTRALQEARTALAAVQKRAPELDAQIEYVEAKGRFEAEKTQRAASAGVLNLAANRLQQATGDRAFNDSFTLRLALKDLRSAEEQAAHIDSKGFKGMVADLQKAEGIQRAVDSGKLAERDVNMRLLRGNIENMSRVVRNQAGELEARANRLITDLESPDFQQALLRLPDAQRADILGRMTGVLSRTEGGKRYLEQNLLPYLKAASDPAAAAALKDLPENKLWKNVFTPANQTLSNADTVLKVLEGTGAFIANRADATHLVEGALSQALALKPGQLKTVEDAVILRAQGQYKEADALLQRSGLGRLGRSMDVIGKSLTTLNGLLTIADFVKDPSLQSAVAAGKSTAELIAITQKLASQSSRYAKFAGMAGKAVPAFDIIQGAMGLYGKDNAPSRGDVGGTVGNALMLTGGTVAAAGLVATGTVVGSVAGVPLTVVGGVIAGVGAAVDFVFGDSETDKWLKQNAPEYLK